MEDQILVQNTDIKDEALLKSMRQACKKIAPVWPLENFVAVNPYLGLVNQKFETTAQQLANLAGIQMTLPLAFYANKIKEGKITREDIAAAISKSKTQSIDPDKFIHKIENVNDQDHTVPTIASLIDVAAQVTEKDWNRFVTSRISGWAASYFDNGQAIWSAADQKASLFKAWKAEAEMDRTPEITGLKGFRNAVKTLPHDPLEAVRTSLGILEISDQDLPNYLHRMLLKVGGWSAYAARLDWDSELYGGKDGKLIEFLAVLVSWEACLFVSLDSPKLRVKWIGAKKALSAAKPENMLLDQKLILQEAFDLASQREIIAKFKGNDGSKVIEPTQVKAQAIFCIDVRSEVYRRNLELVDQGIETIGFAGFFAFPINYIPIAHDKGEAQCPVLIKTGPTILEEIPNNATNQIAYQSRVLKNQVRKLWKSLKSGAVTCFSYVSPLGLSFLPKLFTDSFGLTRPVPHPEKAGLSSEFSKTKSISLEVGHHHGETVGIPMEQRIQMAKNALNAMSLTENFGKFVLIVGHGATTVNNPHATGLDCGACGGHSGEANARVAAAVLNDKMVRQHLKDQNLAIPDSTVFLACLHDTTTDEVSIFNEHEVPASLEKELTELKTSLAQAGHA